MMEKIKDFVSDFIQNEYACNLGKYDMRVGDVDYDALRKKMYAYFLPGTPDMYGRGMSIHQLMEDEEWKIIYSQNLKSVTPRPLFQIRRYLSPNLGSNFSQVLNGKELFGVVLGDVEDLGRPVYLSREIFISVDDDKPQIIYHKSFSSKLGTWRHSHDHAPTRVEDPGTLVEVQNFVTPEDEASLKEYLRVAPQ